MATYEYVCPDCGRFDVHLPIGTAPASRDCLTCGRDAHRAFSPPNIYRTHPALSGAFDREERSREAPEVVSGVPHRRSPRPPHPALAHLPRP
ncbi:FmdB family zinc ribbon protein [Streptosporangium sp. CA-135522]|uniref:FmdB family zinc ribbon protein n=1 Tax=Streptosporangium sp. CA-135522 TaxID=3240072 RepID=UPI003D915ED7